MRCSLDVVAWQLLCALIALMLTATPAAPAAAAVAQATPARTAVSGSSGLAGPPTIHTPSPRPGEVVSAGEVALGAMVASDAGVVSATLTIDGVPVDDVSVEGASQIMVSGSASLGPGEHTAVLAVQDGDGGRVERRWQFTAGDLRTRRLAGEDRFHTGVRVSMAAFPVPGSATAAVLARADDYADGLAGVPLAAATGGPLLLSEVHRLTGSTAGELRRALAPGSVVHLLGGEAALAPAVADDVAALGFTPVRHHGRDRFETAAAVARALPPSAGAVLASGTSFPDALAASAPAARDGNPVLLTAPDGLPRASAAVLAEREVTHLTIVGGVAAVGAAVEQEAARAVPTVQRLAGPDRYATAVAVLRAFYPPSHAMALASGTTFPDALTGTLHAAHAGLPLLLSDPARLPPATAEAIRGRQPRHVTVYGGRTAVEPGVVAALRRAAVDGVDAPRVLATSPAASATVGRLPTVSVTLDRVVDPARSTVYVEVGGLEIPGIIDQTEATSLLTVRLAADLPALPFDTVLPARVVVAAAGSEGTGHDELALAYVLADPVFATAGDVALHLPSSDVEMVAFHESNHDGARELVPRATSTPKMTLPSRLRGNAARTAADVVAAPHLPVLAPVSGRVVRAGSYPLYCRHRDHYVVIEPDARPGWEVKVLHFTGLQVQVGERVLASQTVLGEGPRTLPLRSQIDEFSDSRNWPHLHLEVVDPSVPDRPGPGC